MVLRPPVLLLRVRTLRPEALVDRVSAGVGSGTTLERGSLGQYWSRSRLAAELDEERFERQRRAEVELLEGAPGLADELAGTLRSGEALGRPVLVEHLAPVGVDDCALRTDRHDDQIAVPRCELLERREQLLSFGAAGCPAHALLRLAGREVEQLEPFFGFSLRLGAAFACAVEDALRRLPGLELRFRVHR